MNRWKRVLFGPESIWLLLWVVTALAAKSNQPSTENGNLQLETFGWYLSLGGPALSFLPLAFGMPTRWWLLGRILLAGAIGLFVTIGDLCVAIDYHDSRNTGVGVAWMFFISMGYMILLAGGLIASLVFLIQFLKRNRAGRLTNG